MSNATAALPGSDYPPVLIRGVERVITRADWADMSFRPATAPDLSFAMDMLRRFAPGPSTRGRGFNHYSASLAADTGDAAVLWDGLGDAAGTALLRLRGGWWSSVEDPAARCAQLLELEGNLTRFDLAADFVGDGVPTVPALAAAIRQGDWSTRLRTAQLSEDLRSGKGTIYLGSAASDRRLRVYDQRGPLRVEHRNRDSAAVDLLAQTVAVGAVSAHRAATAARVAFPTVPGWAELLAAA